MAKEQPPAVGNASGMAATAPRKQRLSLLRRHPWLFALTILLVAAALYRFFGRDSVPAVQPLIATIEYGNIENTVTAAGTLQPSHFVDVGAQVSGQLKKLYVDVGAVVQKSDPLAEIDATVQANRVEASRASLKAQEAQLSAREATLKLAEADAERQTRLMKENASTQEAFDSAMNNLASAQSNLVQLRSQIEQSRASLASDEAQLGYTKIFAPISGTVVDVHMKEGQTLNAAQQTPVIMRIADLTTMTVEAQVSEADVMKLKPGMDVYFTTLGSGSRRWRSALRQILPTPVVSNNVVLYSALFDIENSDNALLPSMTAQIFFVTSSAKNALKVPVGALTYASDGHPAAAAQATSTARGSRAGVVRTRAPDSTSGHQSSASSGQSGVQGVLATVQLVHDNGTTEVREVRIGVTSRISAEALSGLKEGDKVIAGVVQPRADPAESRPSGALRFR